MCRCPSGRSIYAPCLTRLRLDINNVGAISQALFAHNNPDYDEVKAAQWQATQVSTVSIMNFLGRISIGPHHFPLCLGFVHSGADV